MCMSVLITRRYKRRPNNTNHSSINIYSRFDYKTSLFFFKINRKKLWVRQGTCFRIIYYRIAILFSNSRACPCENLTPKMSHSRISRWYTWLIVNSWWPTDDIWQHKSGSTLVQVMACCLTAPSLSLYQCWLIINYVQRHSSDDNFTCNTSVINHQWVNQQQYYTVLKYWHLDSFQVSCTCYLWPLLLTWFNFNPSMDK